MSISGPRSWWSAASLVFCLTAIWPVSDFGERRRQRAGSVPADPADDVRTLVGPHSRGRKRRRLPARVTGQEIKTAAWLSDRDNLGREPLYRGGFWRGVQQTPGRCQGSLGEPRYDRQQIEIAVADVEQNDAARRELLLVQRDRFAGQQVQRDRVGAERVDHDQIVAAVGDAREGQPGIAEHDPRLVAACLPQLEEPP